MTYDEYPKVYVPQNLDIAALINDFLPGRLKSLQKDKLLYILGLISLVPSRNKKLRYDNGYVPLNASLLRNNIKDYKVYLDYLIKMQVLECDYHYITNEKSYGYRFTKRYLTVLVPYEIKRYSLRKLLNKLSTPHDSNKREIELPYLQKWWNSNLRINYVPALAWLAEEYHRNIKVIDKNKARWKYIHHKMALDSFHDNQFYFRTDTTSGRLHTNLTNMKSGLRNFITYDDMRLVSVDIKNSQPFLLGTLFNENFYSPSLKLLSTATDDTSKKSILEKADAYYTTSLTESTNFTFSSNTTLTFSALSNTLEFKNINISRNLSNILHYIMIGKNELSPAAVEFQKYLDLTANGALYEYIEKEVDSRLGIVFRTRKKLKEVVFLVLFSDNRFIGQHDAKPKKIFRELFPHIYKLTSLIKTGDSTLLPRLLQAIEANIIIKKVCLRISLENPQIPIFTIHDSIVCPVGFEHYVSIVIKEEMLKAIGIVPSLKYEYWVPENSKSLTNT